MIKVGNIDVKDIRIGNTPVKRVMQGTVQIWPEIVVSQRPAIPTGFNISNIDVSSATMTWDVISGLTYEIGERSSTSTTRIVLGNVTSAYNYITSNKGAERLFSIRAKNSQGQYSDWSADTIVYFKAPVLSQFDISQGTSVNNSIRIAFQRVVSNQNASSKIILQYDTNASFSKAVTVYDSVAGGGQTNVNNLTIGETYYLRGRNYDADGDHESSDWLVESITLS